MGKAIDIVLFAIANGMDECKSNVTLTRHDVWMKRSTNVDRNTPFTLAAEKSSATVSIAINIEFDEGPRTLEALSDLHPLALEMCVRDLNY